jgi:predicted amidophosphoribosyltransferase
MAFAAAWSPLAYGGPAAALVSGLKERGVMAAAAVMAGQVAALAPPALLDGAVLVPVPADPWRRRRRGVDHAAALAANLARRRGLAVAPVLRRAGFTAGRAAGAPRAERLRSGRVVVEVRGPTPELAVLVDDVHTTGATLDACAQALRARGTRSVHAVCYARTLPMGRHGRSLGGT